MYKKIFFSLLSGALFGVGLTISGMTQPAKVIGFLNFAGLANPARFGIWDASLGFVMAGALAITIIGFSVTPRLGNKPWADTQFRLPTKKEIDIKLVAGSVLFGVGWGIAGYCPGPAFASLVSAGTDSAIFTAFLLVGMWLAKRITK
jgi:uncharacterized protein